MGARSDRDLREQAGREDRDLREQVGREWFLAIAGATSATLQVVRILVARTGWSWVDWALVLLLVSGVCAVGYGVRVRRVRREVRAHEG